MDLKEKLLSISFVLEDESSSSQYINDIRLEAIERFENQGFPTKELEAWKYTSLNKILKNDFKVDPKSNSAIEYADVKSFFLHEIDSYKIVFIDGVYSSHLSNTSHDGYDICIMSAALSMKKYQKNIEKYYNKACDVKEHLTTLNTAFAKEGAYIYIPKGKSPHRPVQIVHISTGKEESSLFQPRNLVIVEDGAQVSIIERHQNLSENTVFTNVVTEIFADKNALINYYKIQNDSDKSSLVDNTYIKQKDNSRVSMYTFSFGGDLIRNNLNFYQEGFRIDSTLKGVTILDKKQHVDHYTLVYHQEPNCESHQDYKSILGDSSTGVFNGKIIVNKEAQKTNAFQQNNNILVSERATINAKPQLEIFADDVKCSHGCTIGQLDKDALFYFQSRGIPKKEAEALLMYAFSNNILSSVTIPELKKRIHLLIAKKLSVKIGFDL